MSHVHTPHSGSDNLDMFTQEFWDTRYRSAERIWSGNPNPHLVAQVADLTPRTALDVGCGEGADAIWLAVQGWRVTAIDISKVALERAAEQAATAGKEVADRITWRQADVLSEHFPETPQHFDLVSAQFMHIPGVARQTFVRRLAAAVGPGGTLLIVGHHPSDLATTVGRPNIPDLFFTAEEITAALQPPGWQIIFAGAPERETLDPDGHPVMIRDAVVRATRRT